jgi:hypothetical protein
MTADKKTIGFVLIGLIVLGLLWWFFGRGDARTPEQQSLQQQLENSKELHDVVHSERNDFTKGTYSLDAGQSVITWTYGENTGELPVKNGTLTVLDSGRIEGFTVEADVTKLTVKKGADVKKILGATLLNSASFPNAKMVASTVLPNTVDDAFTVAFSLDAGGKSTSLATGMFVKHEGEGIQVTGDITIDPKTLGFTDSTQTLTISPVYLFK